MNSAALHQKHLLSIFNFIIIYSRFGKTFKNIIFCGHSTGGALACLLAMHAMKLSRENIKVFAIASPPYLTEKLEEKYKHIDTSQIYQIFGLNDPIPSILQRKLNISMPNEASDEMSQNKIPIMEIDDDDVPEKNLQSRPKNFDQIVQLLWTIVKKPAAIGEKNMLSYVGNSLFLGSSKSEAEVYSTEELEHVDQELGDIWFNFKKMLGRSNSAKKTAFLQIRKHYPGTYNFQMKNWFDFTEFKQSTPVEKRLYATVIVGSVTGILLGLCLRDKEVIHLISPLKFSKNTSSS